MPRRRFTKEQEQEQIIENDLVLRKYNQFKKHHVVNRYSYLDEIDTEAFLRSNQLRHMNARVFTNELYHVLRSYETIVAFIDRETGVMYDVQEINYPIHNPYNYGYPTDRDMHGSPTTHRQISAFYKDYHAKNFYTYREIE